MRAASRGWQPFRLRQSNGAQGVLGAATSRGERAPCAKDLPRPRSPGSVWLTDRRSAASAGPDLAGCYHPSGAACDGTIVRWPEASAARDARTLQATRPALASCNGMLGSEVHDFGPVSADADASAGSSARWKAAAESPPAGGCRVGAVQARQDAAAAVQPARRRANLPTDTRNAGRPSPRQRLEFS